ARHYLGWTSRDLSVRLAEHAAGRGARLTAAVAAAGGGWELARTWPGTRAAERRLKARGGAAPHCPACLRATLARAAPGRVFFFRRRDLSSAWVAGRPPAGWLSLLRRADRAGLLTSWPRACHPDPAPGYCPCPGVAVRLTQPGWLRLRALSILEELT